MQKATCFSCFYKKQRYVLAFYKNYGIIYAYRKEKWNMKYAAIMFDIVESRRYVERYDVQNVLKQLEQCP